MVISTGEIRRKVVFEINEKEAIYKENIESFS
jgi:hypothetical protein